MVRKCGGTMSRRCPGRSFRMRVEVITGSVEMVVNQERIEGIYNFR
jgi:hypothetical protein